MSYQVLARKWRPKTFSELVGQEPIVTALGNALRDGRVAQAYLFSGIRGVGKTTAARLLARALNAEPGDDAAGVADLVSSADLDVIEVDAATYSKVEQVRELTESLRYRPAGKRYKVVIIDEVHRLSRQAFDALLKIVEEPPPHLVFIFATTEVESVPATILSRSQEFHFRRVPVLTLLPYLRRVADAEGITVTDPALRLIARAGEGSVRDAIALLDQLATFGQGAVSDTDATRLLGGLDTTHYARALEAIVAAQPAAISSLIAELEAQGLDPRTVYAQFLSYCRDALHCALGADPAQLDLPADEAEALAERARRTGYENLLRVLHLLLQSETVVRRSEAGYLAVEVAWLRAAELPRLLSLERVLAGYPSDGEAAAAAGSANKERIPRAPQRAVAVAGSSAEPATPAKPPPALDSKLAAENPTVRSLLAVFGGQVKNVLPDT